MHKRHALTLLLGLALVALPLLAQTTDTMPPSEEQDAYPAAVPTTSDQEEIAPADPAAEPAEDPVADQATQEEPATAPIEEAPAVATQTNTLDEEREAGTGEALPRTASPLALLALIGATGTGAATAVRRLRRRQAER